MEGINYGDFFFSILTEMINGIEDGAQAIAASLIGLIDENNILEIIFAIQLSFLAFKFTLDGDYLETASDFIKLVAVYIIILSVLANWDAIGFGFVHFVIGLLVGALTAGAGALSGGALNVEGVSNPVDFVTGVKPQFIEVINDVRNQANSMLVAAQEAARLEQVTPGEAAANNPDPATPSGP